MTNKLNGSNAKQYIISGKFMGFSNSGFDTAFFSHTENSHRNPNTKYFPADFKVDDKALQSILKDSDRNTEMQIIVEFGTIDGNVYAARIVNIIPKT